MPEKENATRGKLVAGDAEHTSGKGAQPHNTTKTPHLILSNSTQKLLAKLWQGGQWAYFWTPNTGRFYVDKKTGEQEEAKESLWFPVEKVPAVPASWAGRNVYFGVHPGTVQGERWQRGRNSTVAAINCFFGEFDVKDYGNKEAILSHLQSLPLYPSAIIDSGGGYHAYWLLAHPVAIDDENRTYMRRLLYAWVDLVGSDSNAKDMARVLRLPGSMNLKPAYGPNFPQVQFVECDLDRTYPLERIEEIAGHLVAVQHEREPYEGSTSTLDDMAAAIDALQRLGKHHADDYSEWIKVGQALKAGLGDAGLPLWREWSATSSKYEPGTCEAKWATFSPDSITLGTLIYMADQDAPREKKRKSAGQGKGQQAKKAAQNGASDGGPEPATSGKKEGGKKEGGKEGNKTWVTSLDIMEALYSEGYSFRLNEVTERVEVNGEFITDGTEAKIRTAMRDVGFTSMEQVTDAYLAEAYERSYHPIKEILEALQWDGKDHIAELCSYVSTKPVEIDGQEKNMLAVFLPKFLVCAVAKVFAPRKGMRPQNFVLTLEGSQGIGKSTWVRKLAEPLGLDYYQEGPIDPESKDHSVMQFSKFLWEVGELGKTMRKADREALKAFITRSEVTVRKTWARHDVSKPALANFIGTVNDETGFLSDPTGNRRFVCVPIKSIDLAYQSIDMSQVWAQAVALYRSGFDWVLTQKEIELRDEQNEQYKVPDMVRDEIANLYRLVPESEQLESDEATTGEILHNLRTYSEVKLMDERSAETRIGIALRSLGVQKMQRRRNGARVWVYRGLRFVGPEPK